MSPQLNTLFRRSNLSTIYNTSTVLELRPAPPPQGAQNNVTKVEVLVQLAEPRSDAVFTLGTTFIEGMHNAHRRMWLGHFNVKLDDIAFSGEPGRSGAGGRFS